METDLPPICSDGAAGKNIGVPSVYPRETAATGSSIRRFGGKFMESAFALRMLLSAMAVPLAFAATCAPAMARGYSVLYSFCSEQNCTDGARPLGLVEDKSDNLFGMTYPGGANTLGVIFELSPSTNSAYAYHVLYNFCSQPNCADGALPVGALVLDRHGNLYGVTEEGGSQQKGNVFELVSKSGKWKLRVLYSFCSLTNCTDGKFPSAGLAYAGAQSGAPYDSSRPIFGTTQQGGTGNGGTAYALHLGVNGWTAQVLYNFCSSPSCGDGSQPAAPLLVDSSSSLFGTTVEGGDSNEGTVFEISPDRNGWAETVLHSFCAFECQEGSVPGGGLTMDPSGALLGFANAGGLNCIDRDHGFCGLFYSLVPNGTASTYSVLYTFGQGGRDDDGANPFGAPVLDAKGDIFGTTAFGGSGRGGVLFRLSGSKLKLLHTFCMTLADGCGPTGVIRDRAGLVFGTTFFGGPNDSNGIAYAFVR